MKEVTRDEFFKAIGPLNVHPTPVGNYSYLSIFKTPFGEEVGRIQDGNPGEESQYFLSR